MNHLYILLFSLFISSTISSQTPEHVVINMSKADEHYYYNYIPSKNSDFILEQIPKKISLILPTTGFSEFKLQINKSGTVFSIAFDCQQDSTCIPILLSDVSNGTLELMFHNNRLIGIGTRVIQNPFNITMDKGVYFKVIQTVDNKLTNKPSDTQIAKITLCDNITLEQAEITLDSLGVFDYLCRRSFKETQDSCAQIIGSKFNYAFERPCLSSDGHALSSKYRIIYDYSMNPEGLTFLKIKRKHKLSYYKVKRGPLRPNANAEVLVSVIGPKDSTFVISSNEVQFFMDDQTKFISALGFEADSLQKETIDSQKGVSIYTPEKELKLKLVDLNSDMITFNLMHPSVEFNESNYKAELLCFQQKISRIIGIPLPKDGSDLEKHLINKIAEKDIQGKYYRELCVLISGLKIMYNQIISRKAKYNLLSETINIGNTDAFTLNIKTSKSSSPFLSRTFDVSGGFKIDFSTGFFFTGHSSGDFILSNQNFIFKETRDSVLTNGSVSSVYTGALGDTTLTIIKQNQNFTFGTGVYLHFYPRTGLFFDLGGSAGVILDNTAQIKLLIGGSLMFKAGQNRIALVSGVALGREKTLSIENQQSFLSNENLGVYNNITDLPSNFSGTNPTTYEKWVPSWFIGLTFNFASTNK